MNSPQRIQGWPPDLLRDAILAHAPVAVIVHDRNLRIVCANEAFRRMTGYRDEVPGKSPFECIPEPLLGALALKEKLPQVRDEGTVIGPEEIHYRSPDGRSLAFWHKSFPLFGADGTAVFVVTLLQDMTAHAVMPDEQYRTIIRTAIDGFWRLDVQGRLLDVNEAYCQMK